MNSIKKLKVNTFAEFKPDLEIFIADGMFSSRNTTGDDWTILHSVCFYGEVDKAKLIISYYHSEKMNFDETSKN